MENLKSDEKREKLKKPKSIKTFFKEMFSTPPQLPETYWNKLIEISEFYGSDCKIRE